MAKPTRYTEEMYKEYEEKGYWESRTLSDVWEQNAKAYPNDEAIADAHTRLTWSEANKWIDRLALGFLELGFQKDDMVVIQLPNSVELCLLRIACERAGLLFSPVLRTWRQKEMDNTLNLLEAVGVVIPWKFREFDYTRMIREMRPRIPKLKRVFVVGNEAPEGTISIKQMVERPIEQNYPPNYLDEKKTKPREFSFVASTTGTTGFPKFVEWPICRNMHEGKNYVEKWEITEKDILAALSPAAGGPNVAVYVSAPMVHAKTVWLEHFTAQNAFEIMARERPTIISLVPAMLIMILRDPSCGNYKLDSLRLIHTTGAALPPDVGKEAQEVFGCPIVGVYGAMDAGGMCYHSIRDSEWVRLYTIGKPCNGNEVKLLDDNGRSGLEVKIGEISVRGAELSSGYYKDPELNAAIFTKDGWYRTGDLGTFVENGNVRLVGRKKEMIIRGGQNIYPVEIENLLITHPYVAQVAVVKMPDPVMAEKVCAYVVPEAGQDFTFDKMISFLKEKEVAPYKLPERLEIIDALPMIAAGQKVDKKALEKAIADKLKAVDQV
ncbi:AMP-binding enzyme [delta proteobacterium NaphS2]|nr:AMP-binding enzyme [delta proteobacterium NaphS2]